MKLIIAGGRDFDDYELLCQTMDKVHGEITEVCCGEAKGADLLGKKWAMERYIPVKSFEALWYKYQKSAGVIRNKEMGDYADCLIAFWDGESPGTRNMISYMEELGKPVYVVRYEKKVKPKSDYQKRKERKEEKTRNTIGSTYIKPEKNKPLEMRNEVINDVDSYTQGYIDALEYVSRMIDKRIEEAKKNPSNEEKYVATKEHTVVDEESGQEVIVTPATEEENKLGIEVFDFLDDIDSDYIPDVINDEVNNEDDDFDF